MRKEMNNTNSVDEMNKLTEKNVELSEEELAGASGGAIPGLWCYCESASSEDAQLIYNGICPTCHGSLEQSTSPFSNDMICNTCQRTYASRLKVW